MISRDATIIMMVALALGGCTPDRDVAQCEVEAIRLYPNNPPKDYDDPPSKYVITCMKAKGYDFSFHDAGCLRRGLGPSGATLSACYETGWSRWLTKRMSR